MQLEPSVEDRRVTIPRLAPSGSPVMIFEVDAAGADEASAPARRCDVRLIGSVRDRSAVSGQRSSSDELSAVLVLRSLTPSRLLSCVRAITRGGALVAPEVLCQMLPEQPEEPIAVAPPELTKRELAVLRMLADGEVTRAIAKNLNYSERTVKNIVREVLLKLNCRTRAHAVALATRQRMI